MVVRVIMILPFSFGCRLFKAGHHPFHSAAPLVPHARQWLPVKDFYGLGETSPCVEPESIHLRSPLMMLFGRLWYPRRERLTNERQNTASSSGCFTRCTMARHSAQNLHHEPYTAR
jgi:hypothetical protein